MISSNRRHVGFQGGVLTEQIDIDLRPVVPCNKANDIAELNRKWFRKPIDDVWPMGVVATGQRAIPIGRLGIELELDPLGDTDAEAWFGHEHCTFASRHRKKLRSQIEAQQFDVIGKDVVRHSVEGHDQARRREFVEGIKIEALDTIDEQHLLQHSTTDQKTHGRSCDWKDGRARYQQALMRVLNCGQYAFIDDVARKRLRDEHLRPFREILTHDEFR